MDTDTDIDIDKVRETTQGRRPPGWPQPGAELLSTFFYNPAKPSGRGGGGTPPGWEGDLLVL